MGRRRCRGCKCHLLSASFDRTVDDWEKWFRERWEGLGPNGEIPDFSIETMQIGLDRNTEPFPDRCPGRLFKPLRSLHGPIGLHTKPLSYGLPSPPLYQSLEAPEFSVECVGISGLGGAALKAVPLGSKHLQIERDSKRARARARARERERGRAGGAGRGEGGTEEGRLYSRCVRN